MNRRNLFLVAAACLALMVLIHTERASAQCCTYDVVATQALNGCWPITVTTDWSGHQTSFTKNSAGPGLGLCGHCTYQCPAGCPWTFSWVSLDGGTTTIPINTPTNINLLCGLCVTVHAMLDPNGCIVIFITPC
jgi:hypothetical protein